MRGKTNRTPGPLVPDRTAVPDPRDFRTSMPDPDAGRAPHPHTNDVDGLIAPEVEPMAPGRTTHGATNNP